MPIFNRVRNEIVTFKNFIRQATIFNRWKRGIRQKRGFRQILRDSQALNNYLAANGSATSVFLLQLVYFAAKGISIQVACKLSLQVYYFCCKWPSNVAANGQAASAHTTFSIRCLRKFTILGCDKIQGHTREE